MYKKVLVPISGLNKDDRDVKTIRKAMSICDGEIIVLHVSDPVAQTIGGEEREQLVAEHAAEGLVKLQTVVAELEQAGVPFHTRVVPGTPAETIVNISDEEKAELIIMYTDGRDGISDMLLGSITERVLRDTNTDLLALRK